MDFVGALNFPNPTTLARGTAEEQADFEHTRLQRPTLVRDARAWQGVHEPGDATPVLADGTEFLLVRAPSRVRNWNDPQEVARIYYDEALVLSKTTMPTSCRRTA